MAHSLTLKRLITLATGCALVASATSILAVQDGSRRPTLIEGRELLPDEVQYEFKITSAIDTNDGKRVI